MGTEIVREWHWAWTGRARMEGWGPGAASSERKERIDVRELAERRKVRAQIGQSWEGWC
jgi:hypothetical protein